MIVYRNIKNNEKTGLLKFLRQVDLLFPIPLSHKQNLEILSDKLLNLGVAIGAYYDEKLVGVICGYANDAEHGRAYISVLCVLTEFQGKSIAKNLVEEFIKECKVANMRKICLYTHSTNERAIGLYRKIGFSEIESDRDGDIRMYYKM